MNLRSLSVSIQMITIVTDSFIVDSCSRKAEHHFIAKISSHKFYATRAETSNKRMNE